ncbi:MAG: O-antigen ligase family protein [Bacteroidetes bacterium]|nr:O-antigen ligase family protein [Fibrella sp.]
MFDQFEAPAWGQTRYWLFGVAAISGALVAGYLTSTMGIPGAVITVLIPLLLATLVGVLISPRFGLFLYVQFSYLIPIVGHFITIELPIPLGTVIEGILVLTLLSVFLNGKQMQWERLHNPAFYLVVFWVVFTCLEFFNPETPDRASWLIRFRTLSFQWLVAAILVSVIPIRLRDVKVLIVSWLIWSSAAALWAFKQQYIGLTESENIWLMTVGARTHLLFGQLRSFSFYSDAAQLGVEMAGATLVCLILAIESKRLSIRLLYLALTAFFFWGFAVTGTRSALFVIFGGVPFYLLLKRDITRIVVGGAVGIALLAFLLFTSIGSSNYQIYRIRTALRPTEDPSFLLRLENQNLLKARLAPLPFGVGLGTSSASGAVYNPNHWAAIIQPDSAYVIVWVETGIVGVSLYIAILLALAGIGVRRVWALDNKRVSILMIALLSQFVGVILMAYSNTIMGQFPTSTMLFITTFLVTTCDRWEVSAKPVSAGTAKAVPVAVG